MMFRISLLSLFLVVFGWVVSPSANAQYVEKDQIFTAGKTMVINTGGAKELHIIYRPGSNISQTQTIKITGASYDWVPRKAGIFALTTPDGPSQTVSVGFGSFPLAGLIVLIIAGTILFGGAIYAAVNLFGDSSANAI